jgi:hypothetical protein
MNGMRCISLWQPWASAMTVRRSIGGGMLKAVETRGWAPAKDAIGQRMAIAAAKTQRDPDTGEKLSAWWMERVKRQGGYRACFEAAGFTDWETLPFGAVVAHGMLARVVESEKLVNELDAIEQDWGDYGPGRYGWVFEDMQVLVRPVPIVGKQGIFWWGGEEVAA